MGTVDERDLKEALKYLLEEYPKVEKRFRENEEKMNLISSDMDKRINMLDKKLSMLNEKIDVVFQNHPFSQDPHTNYNYWTKSKEVADYADSLSEDERNEAESILKGIMSEGEGKSK